MFRNYIIIKAENLTNYMDKIIDKIELIRCFSGQKIPPLSPSFNNNQSSPAAVLVPIIVEPTELLVLFTQRNSQLKNHPGQISFPGGKMEATDTDLQTTALRECFEEVGLAVQQTQVIGQLPSLESSTGFLVTPFIGLITPPLELKIDPLEVAEIFTAPLNYLLDPRHHSHELFLHAGKQIPITVINYQEHIIWGLTAKIIVELAEILSQKNMP